MKIKLRELMDASQAFGKIMNQPLEFKLSYRLMKITKKIMVEQKDFMEVKNGLIIKYGIKDDKNNYQILPDSANWVQYEKDIISVLDEEIDFDCALIPQQLLMDTQVKLTPAELVNIELFIEPDEISSLR